MTDLKKEPSFDSDTNSLTSSDPGENEKFDVNVKISRKYDDTNYWTDRYTENSESIRHFEWYISSKRLLPYIQAFLSDCEKALHIGCGTSNLGIEMSLRGVKYVKNVDISEKVISTMKEKVQRNVNIKKKYEITNRLIWKTADIKSMRYESSSYDVVIDKGTVDSLLCSDTASTIINSLFQNISYTLKPDGYFICVSYGSEDVRRMFFDNPNYKWKLHETIKIPKPQIEGTFYYVYVAQKNS